MTLVKWPVGSFGMARPRSIRAHRIRNLAERRHADEAERSISGMQKMLIARRLLLALGAYFLSPNADAAEERFFNSAGIRIRYIEEGRGEPVVLVHGYTSDAETQWTRTSVLQALAARYRVIALDARGHGSSGKPHDSAQYGPEMGFDILRLLDHLDIARAHIVG